ncbi:MAG: hypothetical protein E7379_01965 [Clostridiales bacterium]|nr:hypothetical protein [Clostridiales bacterium]
MKKSLKISLSLLCMCPLALCACQSNDYYKITAISSSSALGSVSGFSQEKVVEGSTVTLTARENYSINNPLLAWVKDNEYLVKIASHPLDSKERDLSLSIEASESTQGNYTAVFDEQDSSMMYAYINPESFYFAISETPIANESYEITLYYAILSAGSDNYLTYEYKFGDNLKTNIIYFGGLGNNYEYKFKILLTHKVDEVATHTYTLTTNTISKSNFKDTSDISIEFDAQSAEITPPKANFSMSIKKFSTDLQSLITTPATPEE